MGGAGKGADEASKVLRPNRDCKDEVTLEKREVSHGQQRIDVRRQAMAEEWGKLIIRANGRLARLFEVAGSDITSPIAHLANLSGLDGALLASRASHADGITVAEDYVLLEYACAEWRSFAEALFEGAFNIEFYAHIHDEYGMSAYYALNTDGEKVRVITEFEGDDFDEDRARIDLGRWVASLPRELAQALPGFNPLDKEDYVSPEEAEKIDTESWVETDLFCCFRPAVEEESIRAALSEEYHDFYYLHGEDHSVAEWLPLSRRDKEAPRKVLEQLAAMNGVMIYANEFYEGSSWPYRLYKVRRGEVREIMDSDKYKKEELQFLTHDKDEALGFRADWFSMEFSHISAIEETYGLEAYANRRLQLFHEARTAELARHEEIWNVHEEEIDPRMKGIRFRVYYRNLSIEDAEELALALVKQGMFRDAVEPGLGVSGKKTICGPETMHEVLGYLRQHVAVFSDYEVVIDDDCDLVWINSY